MCNIYNYYKQKINLNNYIFSIASEISGQNSSTIISSFLRANSFNSDIGSSSNEIIPAKTKINYLEFTITEKYF